MEFFQADVPDIHPVHQNRAVVHLVQMHDRIDQGGLSCAGSAHETNHLSLCHLQADILQNRQIGLVPKGSMLKFYLPLNIQFHRLFTVLDVRLLIHDIGNTLHAGDQIHQTSGQIAQLIHISVKHP